MKAAPAGLFYVVRWFPKFGPGVWRPLAGVTFMTPRVFRSARAAERVARRVYLERGGVVGVLGPVDDVQVACELLPAPGASEGANDA